MNANCTQWGCTETGFYKWFMQNIPGYENGIVYKGIPMRNWWEAMYDFNAFIDAGRSLYILPPKIHLPLVLSNYLQTVQPIFVYPENGATLDYEGSYLFKVEPIPDAQGFLWGFFQNGVMVWENLRDEGTLSGNEYGIHPGTVAHSQFAPGSVEVWVRALINEQWTEPTIITIYLH